METKQTAVDWLEDKIATYDFSQGMAQMRKYILQAKQMEEDQIISSWENGFWEGCEDKLSGNSGLQYYNETYNQKQNDN